MEKEPTTLFSAQINEADLEMFNVVAAHEGQTKVGVLRVWISRYHSRIVRAANAERQRAIREAAIEGAE
jgi:hypothetical protein